MKSFWAAAMALCLLVVRASATTHFVDLNSTNPVPPYTNWIIAATNIQDAVNVAAPSDTVLVTNGIYQYGASSFDGSNRVVISAGVTVQSVNGPAVTTIKGYQAPGTTNGPNSVRCVFIQEFGRLNGFTLTGGATGTAGSGAQVSGGGVATDTSCSISNCIIVGNTSYGDGGGAYLLPSSALTNCVIAGNSSGFGGGVCGSSAYAGAVVNCVLSNNLASDGGGVAFCAVYSSLLVGNGRTNGVVGTAGGAAYISTLNSCTVVGNFSQFFGAADGCILQNSIIYYNFGGGYGDCYQCKLTNCCTPNPGSSPGYNNITNAPGFVNLAMGDYHLNPWSRCVDVGSNAFTTNSFDLDGNPRISGAAADIGAYENQSPFSGPAHYVSLTSTNPVSPYTNWSTAATNVQDAVSVAQAGEFVIAADGVYTNGGTLLFGGQTNRVALTNPVILASAGGPQAAIIAGGTHMRCIYVGSNATLMGFTLTGGHTSTSGDITNEQSGAGAWCAAGGMISNCVVVGNFETSNPGMGGGIFGGTVWNSTLADNNGVNGGGAAMANLYNCLVLSNSFDQGGNFGGGLYRGMASNCTFVVNRSYSNGGAVSQSTLFNCVLDGNLSTLGAGGAYSSALYKCTLTGNEGFTGGTSSCTNYNCTFAGNSGSDGGGANSSVSYSCIFTGNSSPSGGGAFNGYAYNCIFVGNTANNGGGESSCKLLNCTVVGNTATNNAGGTLNGTPSPVYNSIVYYNTCLNSPAAANQSGSTLAYCCTPQPGFGFTNEPLMVNWAGGDFHLQSNSPCINSGNNATLTNGIAGFAILTTDFVGNPRVIGSAADVGAYEFLSPTSILPYSWLWSFGLPTDGSAEGADSDGDGLSNYAEWRAGTIPTNAASALALQAPIVTETNVTITWQAVVGKYYYVQSTPDLFGQPFQTIATNIYDSFGSTKSYTDTNAVGGIAFFYRVGVQ